MTGGSVLPAAAQLGIVALTFVVAFALQRHTRSDGKFRALPGWAQLLVAGLAMTPFMAHTRGLLPTTVVDDSVLMIVLLFGLWTALPPIAVELLDPDPGEAGAAC